MFNEFKTWIESALGSGYVYSLGLWADRPAIEGSYVCSITQMPGPGLDVFDRRKGFRVILLGPIDGRQYANNVAADCEKLIQKVISGVRPCGIAQVNLTSEAAGPGYTNNDRAWFALNFELLF